jgi:hypothetical protein
LGDRSDCQGLGDCNEVFSAKALPGVLVLDRYNGCNQMPCSVQSCYAHLLRDVRDLAKGLPKTPEVNAFVEALVPQLADADPMNNVHLKLFS